MDMEYSVVIAGGRKGCTRGLNGNGKNTIKIKSNNNIMIPHSGNSYKEKELETL